MSQSGDNDLADDPRWRRLWARSYRCSSCDEDHQGLLDLACDNPEQWPESPLKAPNSALDLTGNFLSSDFCVLHDEHFFVRVVLELPIIGSDGRTFGFGVWATLGRENFVRYVNTFDSGEQAELGPWLGWFSNRLMGYPDTLNLKCRLHMQNNRQRPRVELQPTDHPLAVEQHSGVTFDRLLDLYAIYGHDIRRSLSD